MRGSARFLILGGVAALTFASAAAVAVPASARPDAMFTVTVSGIDRNGTSVTPSASVFTTGGTPYLDGGTSVKVPAGYYIVAASIWQPSDGPDQTMVAKEVHVTSNTNVTLNAQGAVAVNATIGVGGLTRGAATVGLCIGPENNSIDGYLVDSPGTSYVKPVKIKGLLTVYQTYWQNTNTGVDYDLAGAFKGGIPSTPNYHANPATMAKVNVQFNSYENVTPLQAVLETYDNCGTTTYPGGVLPQQYTDYRTPGLWDTDLNFGPNANTIDRDLSTTHRTYQASHTYNEVYGSAVTGPDSDFPEIEQHDVDFDPQNVFADPQGHLSFDCEGKATVKLTGSGGQVSKQKLTFCTNKNLFQAHVKKTGWYTLTATENRWNPGGALPTLILSSQITLAWRFHFAPVVNQPIDAQALPVTMTKFVPLNLDPFNSVVAGKTTTVDATVLRGGGEPVPTPKYKLKTPHFFASFNGGTTWVKVPATVQGNHWVLQVAEPVTGARVSLRSVVTDVHGDSTTETVINAYIVREP